MLIAPSILTVNFANLKKEIKKIKHARLLHLDIMDGHLVPNLSFGPKIVKDLSSITKIPFDVHLMLSAPLAFIPSFLTPNTKIITIHIESNNVKESIALIKEKGCQVGLAISPDTAIESIIPYLPAVDQVLIMSVYPGFGGQSFLPLSYEKIATLKQIKTTNNYTFLIAVDGGVNNRNINSLVAAGIDIVVMGSFLFNNNPAKILKKYQ